MISEIDLHDWPDQIQEADGYESTPIPDLTRGNLEFLAGKLNEVISALNVIKAGE